MAKLVVLRLDGDCDRTGVRVFLEIGQQGQRPTASETGYLPADPDLVHALNHWRDRYYQLGQSNRTLKPYKVVSERTTRAALVADCRQAAELLSQSFNGWLRWAAFQPINLKLREELNRHDTIQVVIQTQEQQLQRLPWQQWNFLDRYLHAEVVLGASSLENTPPHTAPKKYQKVKILAILGHSDGIDTQVDQTLLNKIPGADICFLPQPKRALVSEQLWHQPWDILFFAGHSETDQTSGRLYLNPNDSLSLEELRHSLRKAVKNGLKLAIFNSCDGLGLVGDLKSLDLPQIIVMREPIPDLVAHRFLKGFLQSFSQGESMYVAAREARERLEGVEDEFPCASWLPVIYENLAAVRPDWQTLWANGQRLSTQLKSLVKPALVSLGLALVITLIRLLGGLQSWELQAYDQLMALRPGVDDGAAHVLVIAIDEPDIGFQRDQGIKGEGSLSDEALLQILQKITPYAPRAIGFDIIHDFPFSPELVDYLAQQPHFFAICRFGAPQNRLPFMFPPDNLPVTQLGFSDVPIDPGKIVRRQLLGMQETSVCPVNKSLNFQLIWSYLEQETDSGPSFKKTDDHIRFEDSLFQKVTHTSGGYQLKQRPLDGYQILLDYRHTIPSVHLRDILTVDPVRLNEWVNNRVILIGVDNGKDDLHPVPYQRSAQRELPGVFVQAHMVNHVLDSVVARHPSPGWWPQPVEFLWIAVWSLVAGMTCHFLQNRFWQLGGLVFLFGLLYGVSWYMVVYYSQWVPMVPAGIAIGLFGVIAGGGRRV